MGRRVDRGADEAIPPTEFDAIATESVGAPAKASALPDGELGRISVAPGSRLPTAIALSDRLSAGQVPKVYAHELGHAIDQLAGEIPTAGLQRELDRVYNAGISGVHRARNLTGPQHVGYKGDDIPRELMAEAIRAYMTNPTYMKTEARKTAAAIRKAANRDPMVNRIIQFNVLPYLAPGSLAAALAAGAYGAGGSGPAEDM